MLLLAALGFCLVALGVLVLLRFPDRPGGELRFLGLVVNSKGAGLPLIALGAVIVVLAATRDGGDGQPGGSDGPNGGGEATDGGDGGGDTVDVGLDPIDLVAQGNTLWTSNRLGGDLSKVDLAGRGEVNRIDLGPTTPSALAIGAGYLWVADVVRNRIVRVELLTDDYEPIEIGGDAKPSGVAVGAGSVWVTLFSTPGRVVQIDPQRRMQVRSFTVGNRPEDVKVADGAVWATSSTTNVITRIGLPDGGTTRVPIAYRSDDAAVHGRALWVTNRDDGYITRIDLRNPTSQDSFRVGELPEGIAVDQRNVWVVNEADEEVIRLDAHNPSEELGRYGVGKKPSDVAVDNSGVAWVANTGDDTLSRIEP